jgi:hypothetical protein
MGCFACAPLKAGCAWPSGPKGDNNHTACVNGTSDPLRLLRSGSTLVSCVVRCHWLSWDAIATDGGSEAFSIRLVRKPTGINGGGICCAGSPKGYWYVNPTSYLDFEPSSVSLQFADDGGVPDSGDAALPDTEASGDSRQTDSNGDGSATLACGAPGADASTCTSGQFCVKSIAGIIGSVEQYWCATPSGDCVANPTCECLCPVPGNRSPGPGCIAVGAATNSCQCGIVRGVLTLMCGGI